MNMKTFSKKINLTRLIKLHLFTVSPNLYSHSDERYLLFGPLRFYD